MQTAGAMADNVASALCYVLGFITGIIFLVLAPYNKNPAIKFHAFQAIFLSVACIAASIVLDMLLVMMHLWELIQLVRLASWGIHLYMAWMAYQGKNIVLPVIGPIAQQQARN